MMIKPISYFTFLFLFLFSFLHAESSSTALTTFNEIVQLIEKHYYRKDDVKVNWIELVNNFRSELISSQSENDQYQKISDLVQTFEHSHLSFTPPKHIQVFHSPKTTLKRSSKQKIKKYDLNFQLSKRDDAYHLLNINEGSNVYQQGLRNNARLLKVDALDLSQQSLTTSELEDFILERANDHNGRINLHLKHLDDRYEIVELKLKTSKKIFNNFGHMRVKEDVTIRYREDKILYLSFSAFTFEQVWKIKEAIQEYRHAKGVVLDIRDNPGGSGMLACGIALEFCEKDYSLGSMTGPEMDLKFPVFAQENYFKGPLIILVNENSFSTSEILARGMQVANQAIIVGSQTQGLALPSVILKLKDGSKFQYPIADFKDTTGQLLEAQGVTPDYLVSFNENDISKNKDPQLLKAIQIMKNKIEAKNKNQ